MGRDIISTFTLSLCYIYIITLYDEFKWNSLFFSFTLTLICHGAVLWGGERHEGSAPLVLDLLVAYEADQGLVPGRSSYTDTDYSNLMPTLTRGP